MTYLDIYNIEGGDNTPLKMKFALCVAFTLICLALIFFVINPEIQKNKEKATPVAEPSSPPASTGSESATVAQAMQANTQNEQPPAALTQPESNNVISQFTNDLPYQENKETIQLKDDSEYNDILQRMALDDDVIKQHNQYVNDRNKITSTASFEPERSDSQDIVTRWGLASFGYIKPDPSAREVPSQTPEQGSKPMRLRWN